MKRRALIIGMLAWPSAAMAQVKYFFAIGKGSLELREDRTWELREDGTTEIREVNPI
jgi:hypothetical protein